MLHAGGSGATGAAASPAALSAAPAIHQRDLRDLGTGVVFVLIQVFCSVIAGVYNEYIIKGLCQKNAILL